MSSELSERASERRFMRGSIRQHHWSLEIMLSSTVHEYALTLVRIWNLGGGVSKSGLAGLNGRIGTPNSRMDNGALRAGSWHKADYFPLFFLLSFFPMLSSRRSLLHFPSYGVFLYCMRYSPRLKFYFEPMRLDFRGVFSRRFFYPCVHLSPHVFRGFNFQ